MNSKKVNKIIKIIILSSLTIFFLYFLVLNPFLLRNNYRYTIAKITKIESVLNGGPVATFEYSVNSKIYSGLVNIGGIREKVAVDNRYFIKFYSPNPDNTEILTDKIITASIDSVPSNGWEKAPF